MSTSCFCWCGKSKKVAANLAGDTQCHLRHSDQILDTAGTSCSGPLVADLVKENRAAISELRQKLVGWLTEKDDDIVLLRYLLSYPSIQEARDAVIKAKDYRWDHADLFEQAQRGVEPPFFKKFHGKLPSGLWDHATATGSTVWIIRIGFCDYELTQEESVQDDFLRFILYHKERTFLLLDQMTRRTGRLIKGYTILDFENFSIFGKQPSATSEATRISKFLYPQLAAKTIVINIPRFLKAFIAVAKQVMPARALEKFAFCPATGTSVASKGEILTCPFVQREWPNLQKVPDFLGGDCPIKRGSILYVGSTK